jgi:NitT/TauT family transport system permease protein
VPPAVLRQASRALLEPDLAVAASVDRIHHGPPSGRPLMQVSDLEPCEFLSEGQWTLAATVVAFALGSAAGILVGLLFVVWPVSERFLEPIFAALNTMPRIALAPCSCCGSGSASGPRLPSPSA